MPPTDHELVAMLIGRQPMGAFEVVVRRADGSPVVLSNQPLLDSGRPMPTRFWLADRALNRAIGQLESTGAVKAVERELDPLVVADIHARAKAERDALIPNAHQGPRPSGGVGGTRKGVKCLHAHYANLLAGADDAIGRWVQERLQGSGDAFDPEETGIVTDLARQASVDQARMADS